MPKPSKSKTSELEKAERQFVLALSWREEALRAGSAGALRDAEKALAQLRHRERLHLDALGKELRRLLNAQARLLRRLQEGNLSPEHANLRNRHFTQEIGITQAKITRLNRLLSASISAELGGLAHLPLEQYSAAVGRCRPPLWTPLTRNDRWQIAVSAVVLILAVLTVLRFTLWREGVSFQVAGPANAQGAVHLVCTNTSAYPILLCAPPREHVDYPANRVYAIQVTGKTAEEGRFEALPDLSEAWFYQGSPTGRIEPVLAPPGLQAELVLDLKRVPETDAKLRALQIICRKGNRARVFSATIDIPR